MGIDALVRSAVTADDVAIAHLHVDGWRDSYRGIIPDGFLDSPLLEERLPTWRRMLADPPQGRLVLVAEAVPKAEGENTLLGFVSGGPERKPNLGFDAEIYAIYIAAAARRQRIGLRLVIAAVTRLQLFGHTSVMLWTLQDNARARGFSERLGGRPLGERQERFGGAMLTEVAYGWPSLERLLETCYDQLAVP